MFTTLSIEPLFLKNKIKTYYLSQFCLTLFSFVMTRVPLVRQKRAFVIQVMNAPIGEVKLKTRVPQDLGHVAYVSNYITVTDIPYTRYTSDKFRPTILYTHGIDIRFDPCPLRNPSLPSKNSNTGTTFSTSYRAVSLCVFHVLKHTGKLPLYLWN